MGMVRLSAGRTEFSESEQALMFMAGANSIFTGDTLLTTANPAFEEDKRLFSRLGLVGKPPHKPPLSSPYYVENSSDMASETDVLEGYVEASDFSKFEDMMSRDRESTCAKNGGDNNRETTQALRNMQRALKIENGPGVEEFLAR